MNIDPAYFQALRQKLICGEITAFTFDTQAFDRNGRTFKGGLIGHLSQLKNSNIKLVITELVRDEAEKHMLDMHRAKSKKVDDAFALVSQYLSVELRDELCEELDERPNPEQIIFHEFNDFYLATDAEVISCEEVSARKLYELYFNNEPPFHRSNDKKFEFPDAVALLCLEAYALHNGILVVSEDKDWIAFCHASKSKKLHCVPDLPTALALINSVEDDIKEISSQRFVRFQEFNNSGGLPSAVGDKIISRLKDCLLFTARTSYFYNARCADIDVVSIKHYEGKKFSIIRDDSSQTIWVLELDVECRIKVDVTFSDAGESFIGSSQYEQLLLVPSMAIIKISNDNISVETAFDKKTTLDLGAIAPNEQFAGEPC